MVGLKAQALFFLRRAKQAHGRADRHRFEQVGLALPVLAADQVDRRVESEARLFIIAEIFQRKRVNVQSALTWMDGFFLFSRPSSASLPSGMAEIGK